MKFYNHILLCLALNCIWAFTFPAPVSAQTTFKAVSLDCGGWFSGFAQADDGRLYGYGDVFGAWRSDNGGNNWTYLNWTIPEFSQFGQGMTVQRNNSNVVYYRTDYALYKSTDGGATWSKKLGDLGVGTDNAPLYRGSSSILIRANNPNEIWLAAPRKNLTGTLWRSTNGGDSWTKMGGTAFDASTAITLHNVAAYPSQIWVGSVGGLHVSTDGGGTFNRIGTASRLVDVGMISRFTSGTSAGAGVVTRSNTNGGGLSRISATDYNNAATYTITDSITTNVYLGYPTGLQIFSDGTCSAWRDNAESHVISTDGGRNFTVRGTTLNTSAVPIWTTAARMLARNRPDYGTDQVIEAVGNPNKWMITGGGAPMYSLDKGISWQYFPNGNGLAGVKTYSVNTSRFNSNVLYAPGADIGSAIITDGGASGQAAYSSNKSLNNLHSAHKILEGPNPQTLVLAGVNQDTSRSLLLRSTNGGNLWTEINLAGVGLPESSEGITTSVMSLNDANDFVIALANKSDALNNNPGLWRTTNGGATFTPVTGLPSGILTGERYAPISFLDRDATDVNVRYFAARGITVYRSTNGGSNWVPVAHPAPNGLSFDWALSFRADPVRGNNLWAACGWRGVSYSLNGGLSWTPTAQFFDAQFVSSYDGKVAIYGKASGDTAPRIYYSTNNGASFTALTDSSKYFDFLQGLTVDAKGQIWVSWNSLTVIIPPTAVLSGTVSGSAAWANDPRWDVNKAFDGNPATYFAPGTPGNSHATLDLGASRTARVTTIRYLPRSGYEGRMDGGVFQGSNDGSSWTTLASITGYPANAWQSVTITGSASYRYLRYYHATGLADAAEIEFYGTVSTVLTGTISGSAPWQGNTSWDATEVFDGNVDTFFAPAVSGNSFCGIDLGFGKSARITTIRYVPRSGFEWRMNGGVFQGSNDNSNWTNLATITTNPPLAWQTISITNTTAYRYLRYFNATGFADVSEIEFRN